MAADNFKKKASRGLLRTIKCQVTKDPNDRTNEYIDPSELISSLRKKVTQAQIWECPLESLASVLQALGVVHQGIIVTMEDGKRFLVHKLPSENGDGVGCAVVADPTRMGSQWAWVKTKNVTHAKLEDYLDECGDRYDIKTDNCLHAVKRMWTLN